ncbi:MAG TPA: glycosyltransferase family 39 protein, partial [Phycisphaerae bacterium]|nr:glycosyltransferase family 39 protein [Phycisphaerae bacterium]
VMTAAAGLGSLFLLSGSGNFFLAKLFIGLTQAAAAGAVVTAAGGFGYLLVGRLGLRSAPAGLRVVTACGLGLWMLATLVLLVGSFTHGLLTSWVWWPIIFVGIVLAAWQARGAVSHRNPQTSTGNFDARILVWVLVAAAAGIVLAGAMRPPGYIFTSDSYDVLEYHLQIPREFYESGHIAQLPHNCYSHYPLGVEMLFLLAMILRGGAYEGMYLAGMLHAAFGVLTVAAIFASLRRDDEARGRFAAVLLATTPIVLYMGFLAMVELAMLFYLAVGLLWLREWLREARAGSAVAAGLMIGGACAAKYLSVGFVAAPLLAVMVLAGARNARRLAHAALAAVLALAMFSPWLIRNTAYTGNPVFPLATQWFGRGHWSAQSEQRWLDGHGPQLKPPVPAPPDWTPPKPTSRTAMLWRNFLSVDLFGPVVMMLAGLGACLVLAEGWRGDRWDGALLSVAAIQVAVWTFATHGMPSRFVMPVVIPIVLLAGGALARLLRLKHNPLKPAPAGAGESLAAWGRPPAVALFIAAAGVNLVIAFGMYRQCTGIVRGGKYIEIPAVPTPGDQIARELPPYSELGMLPEGSRVMLLGEARAFYFPTGTIYATVFDEHPLASALRRHPDNTPAVVEQLKAMGVTHLWVNWPEMWRLAHSYGFDATIAGDLSARVAVGRPAGLDALDRLGVRVARQIDIPPPPGPLADADWPSLTLYALPGVPIFPPQTQPDTQPALRP